MYISATVAVTRKKDVGMGLCMFDLSVLDQISGIFSSVKKVCFAQFRNCIAHYEDHKNAHQFQNCVRYFKITQSRDRALALVAGELEATSQLKFAGSLVK